MLTAHHDGSPLYVLSQTPALGEAVRVRLRVPDAVTDVAWVGTRSNPDREPRFDAAVHLGEVDGWNWFEASVVVSNPVHGYRWLMVMRDGRQLWLNQRGWSSIEVRDADDFKLVATNAPPEWAVGATVYEIFPDRFARSSHAGDAPLPEWAVAAEWTDPVARTWPAQSQQFFGGDLDGVIEHLDHLVDLHIEILYLTPFFPSQSNHRYDASSFDHVDPLLGGDAALVRLVDAAHARGIRVIGDLTTNHSGTAHEWFRTAMADPDSDERSFYFIGDDGDYETWLDARSLPKLDWSSPELRRRFIDGPDSVVGKYLRAPFSLDGWRIDVANMTGRLRDADLNTDVRRTIRRTMLDINPDTVLFAESTNDGADDFQGDAWHGAMTYAPFTRPLWSWLQKPGSPGGGGIGFALQQVPTFTARDFFDAQRAMGAGYPWRSRLLTFNALDTHDTPRFATGALPGTVPVAFGLSVTLPGEPVVWAGDEFGLTGETGEASRTPMPWTSQAEPDAAAALASYRELTALRREHPVLATGGLRWLAVADEALAFARESTDETLLVFATRSGESLEVDPGAVPGEAEAVVIHGDAALSRQASGALTLSSTGPAFGVWRLPGVRVPGADA